MIELSEECGYKIIGIVDSNPLAKFDGYNLIGTDEFCIMNASVFNKYPLIMSPDQPFVRKKLHSRYEDAGFLFKTLIHPGARISKTASIGKGAVIQSGVNISSNSSVGDFCRLNVFANVMHDSIVGDFTTVAPNAVILGRVNIGSLCYIGSNCTILPELEISSNVTIGAGSVVTKNVSKGVWAGVPAREIKTNEKND